MKKNRTIRNIALRRFPVAVLLLLILPGARTSAAEIPKHNSNPSAAATVYLDFDGQVVKGTAWNWDGEIKAKPATLSTQAMTQVFNRVAEDYRIFNVNITTDAEMYNKAPVARRIRVIITPTSEWYGVSAGISFVNSFTWGDNTPAWVFTGLLENNPRHIGEAASHEAGHTLGLQHQCTYNANCVLQKEYAEGKGGGETGWAPIMGLSYYKNFTTWHTGPSIGSCIDIQDDIKVISEGTGKLGLRTDDHGNAIQWATTLNPGNGNSIQASGIISTAADRDLFKITLPVRSAVRVKAAPFSVGPGNAGANLDIELSLLDDKGKTIRTFNPGNILDASADTTLAGGVYYIAIDGTGNQHSSDYGSRGSFTITGTVTPVVPVTGFSLTGSIVNKKHSLRWDFVSTEPVKSAVVEYSFDAVSFRTVATVSPAVRSLLCKPIAMSPLHYRVRLISAVDGNAYFSNTVTLAFPLATKIKLFGTIVDNRARLSSPGVYSYQLSDGMGKLIGAGRLRQGNNDIDVSGGRGVLLLRVFDQREQVIFRLIKP